MEKCEQCGKIEEPKPESKDRIGAIQAVVGMYEYRMEKMRRIGNHRFCSIECKDQWVEKYNICSYEMNIKFIMSFDILIIPTDRSLPDPQADVEILINARIKDIELKEDELVCLGFDLEKNEFTHCGSVMKFANGEEMAGRIRGALIDKL